MTVGTLAIQRAFCQPYISNANIDSNPHPTKKKYEISLFFFFCPVSEQEAWCPQYVNGICPQFMLRKVAAVPGPGFSGFRQFFSVMA